MKLPKPIQAIVGTPSTLEAREDLNLRPLGYEQAERCRNPSRPVAHTHAGLGRRHDAVSTRLVTSGAFRGVLVTITVTRADGGLTPTILAAQREAESGRAHPT